MTHVRQIVTTGGLQLEDFIAELEATARFAPEEFAVLVLRERLLPAGPLEPRDEWERRSRRWSAVLGNFSSQYGTE
jgi:hypothetical protein